MGESIDRRACPNCGQVSDRTGTQGLCPACLLQAGIGAVSVGATDPVAGSVINGFRIVEKIGEGGMGIVYFAEQEEPVRRDVAFKLIRTELNSGDFTARFESERHTLAMMDHPFIARIFDAGTTEEGRPYFAMEFVEGRPVTSFCDGEKLTLAQRLKLFLKICDAVEHAHQKGVIHSDLKPSNILVSSVDLPKVIDFGLAKVVSPGRPESGKRTARSTASGTPGYMSPEQEKGSRDIDTRADIYALGSVLEDLADGNSELREVIDKARQEDAGERYQTVGELARDVTAFLECRPVAAVRQTLVYRFGKFFRRNVSAVLGWLALVLAAAATIAYFASVQAARQRELEIQSENEHERRIGNLVSGIFQDVVRVASIDNHEKREAELYGLLDGLSQMPDTEVRMELTLRRALGAAFNTMNRPDEAERELKRAKALMDDSNGALRVFIDAEMARALMLQGRTDEAKEILFENLAWNVANAGPDHEDTLQSVYELGLLFQRERDFESADIHLSRAAGDAPAAFGRGHPLTLEMRFSLAELRADQERYEESRELLAALLPEAEQNFGEHPVTEKTKQLLSEVEAVLAAKNENL